MTGNDQPERELQVYHHAPADSADRFALGSVKFLRFLADSFFQRRYGHRAVILETVAAVPGMVGGALTHLKSLRRFEDDRGWIKALLDEAQNERAHLMTFTHLATPNWFERCLVIAAQGVFFNLYFFTYLFWPRAAHRFVGHTEPGAITTSGPSPGGTSERARSAAAGSTGTCSTGVPSSSPNGRSSARFRSTSCRPGSRGTRW